MSESISLDGVISRDEWNDASIFNLEYEVMPSRNTEAALETKAYVKFDKKYLCYNNLLNQDKHPWYQF